MNWVPRATQILLLWKVSSTMMKFDENHWMVWELKYRNIGDWKNRTLFSREGWSSLHQKARMASTRSDSPRAVLAYVVLVSEKAEVPEDTENLMSTVCQQQQTTWAQEFHSKQTNEWNNFHIVDSPRDPRLELQPSLCIWCTQHCVGILASTTISPPVDFTWLRILYIPSLYLQRTDATLLISPKAVMCLNEKIQWGLCKTPRWKGQD